MWSVRSRYYRRGHLGASLPSAQAGDPSAVRAKCSGWRAASSQASPTLTFLITINAQYSQYSWIRTFVNIEVSQSQRRPLLLVESTMVGRHEIGDDAKVIRNEQERFLKLFVLELMPV